MTGISIIIAVLTQFGNLGRYVSGLSTLVNLRLFRLPAKVIVTDSNLRLRKNLEIDCSELGTFMP